MLFKRKKAVQKLTTPPIHFPAEFAQLWHEVDNPAAIRRELASLMLADLRATGPGWPTERFQALHELLNTLEKMP